ncbi:hypothetical protein [Cellvibrio sp.]
MSKETRLTRTKALYEQFLSLNPREFENFQLSLTDFDGLNFDEAKRTMRFVLDTFDGLSANDAWSELTWHALSSIESVLQAMYNAYAQLKNTRDQNSFQNLAPQIDSMAYHMRMFGVSLLASGGIHFERTTTAISIELEKLMVARAEVEKLRDEVKTLIAPAVAGSLSESFTQRKKVLLWGRIAWGSAALLVGGIGIFETYQFANSIGAAILAVKVPGQSNEIVWASILLRSIVLLPLFAAFGFSFSQYKKERDFEEEYAHKAAVATSLPNYGDLTREPSVRDQIVTAATNVIFSTPAKQKIEPENSEKLLDSVKELFDSIAKILPKKE